MKLSTFVLAASLIAFPAVTFAEGEGETTTTEGAATEPVAAPAGDPTTAAPAGDAAAPGKKMTVGADVGFVLPLGDYADGATLGLGVLGRFEYAVTPQISATARIGFIYNLLKDVPDGVSASLNMIPVMLGGTYKIGTSGLFAYGEVGLTNIRASASAGGMEFSDSETKLAIGAGAGYQMNKIKARVGFWMPGSQSDDDGMGGTTTSTLFGILASAGYDFASF
jgi:Outer membrane protein beta-barrel domain